MNIGGLHKFSLIDFHGKMCAVIFTQGCNFKCSFCHNSGLLSCDTFEESYCQENIFEFLESRIGLLEGVVITGGEPTMQKNLIPFLEKVKGMGYSVKLDTNGSNPDVLEKVVQAELVDYIAMDIKAPPGKYRLLACTDINIEKIKKSIDIIQNSGLEYEFRTTVVSPFLDLGDLQEIASLLNDKKKYKLQEFVPKSTVLDVSLLESHQYSSSEIEGFQQEIAN